jgi:hypothetical protein
MKFFSMIGMASNGHFRFVEEVLYVYTRSNPISELRNVLEEQKEHGEIYSHQTALQPARQAFLN